MVISHAAISLAGLLVVGAGDQSATANQNAATICQTVDPHLARGSSPDRPHTLNEEPPGRATFTVLYSEDGCSRPVHVNSEKADKTRR